MDYDSIFIIQKTMVSTNRPVDWSLLNDGMTIPVSACALLKAWDESIYFTLIIPNYHRIIHKNNPHFNRKKFQFEFENGEVLGLKLYEHLKV